MRRAAIQTGGAGIIGTSNAQLDSPHANSPCPAGGTISPRAGGATGDSASSNAVSNLQMSTKRKRKDVQADKLAAKRKGTPDTKNIAVTNVKERKHIVLAHGMDKDDGEKMNENIGGDHKKEKKAKQTNGDEEAPTQCNADDEEAVKAWTERVALLTLKSKRSQASSEELDELLLMLIDRSTETVANQDKLEEAARERELKEQEKAENKVKKERAEAPAWDGIVEETDNSHSPMEDVKSIIDGGHGKKSKLARDEIVCHLPSFLVLTHHNNL